MGRGLSKAQRDILVAFKSLNEEKELKRINTYQQRVEWAAQRIEQAKKEQAWTERLYSTPDTLFKTPESWKKEARERDVLMIANAEKRYEEVLNEDLTTTEFHLFKISRVFITVHPELLKEGIDGWWLDYRRSLAKKTDNIETLQASFRRSVARLAERGLLEAGHYTGVYKLTRAGLVV